jgi:hypothetical protein
MEDVNEGEEEVNIIKQTQVLQKDNPLITTEYNQIIEAAIPKHEMK